MNMHGVWEGPVWLAQGVVDREVGQGDCKGLRFQSRLSGQ